MQPPGLCSSSYPQVGVELVQHQTHGARQVADIRGFLVQSVLENLKVLHPLHCEAVVDNVSLHKQVNNLKCQEEEISTPTQHVYSTCVV